MSSKKKPVKRNNKGAKNAVNKAETTLRRERKKSSAIPWDVIRQVYVFTSFSTQELADRFGVSHDVVRQRAYQEGWVDERNRVSQDVSFEAQKKMKSDRVTILRNFNQADLEVAEKIRDGINAKLNRFVRSNFSNATPATLRTLAGAAEIAQRIGRLALGLSTGIFDIGESETNVPQGLPELYAEMQKKKAGTNDG